MLAGREHGFSMGNTRQRNCPSWQPPARKPSLARSSAHNWSQAHPCPQCASPAGFLRPAAGPAAEQAEPAEHAAAAPAWHDPATTRHPALAAASWPGRGGTPPAAAAPLAGCAERPRRLQAGLRRPMPAGPAGPAGRGIGPAAPRLQDGENRWAACSAGTHSDSAWPQTTELHCCNPTDWNSSVNLTHDPCPLQDHTAPAGSPVQASPAPSAASRPCGGRRRVAAASSAARKACGAITVQHSTANTGARSTAQNSVSHCSRREGAAAVAVSGRQQRQLSRLAVGRRSSLHSF